MAKCEVCEKDMFFGRTPTTSPLRNKIRSIIKRLNTSNWVIFNCRSSII